MNTRYHIEELVSQDARGVVFQGVDTITGVVVAMRRFISAAIDGGEVRNGKGRAYEDAIEVLKKVSHPSLRRVLAGGCDPVDGMPYLVTRWIDGISLGEVVAIEGPLDPDVVVLLLAQLLNANMTLSKSLGSDGLWAETSLDSVVIQPQPDDGEMATAIFWVSPWRWLDEGASKGGAMELADFAEAMLGGPRHVATHHADTALAVWIQDLRNKKLTDLRAIQEALNTPGTPVSPFVLEETKDTGSIPKNRDAPAVRAKPSPERQPTPPFHKTGKRPPPKAPPAAAQPSPSMPPPPPPRSGGKAFGFAAVALLLIALIAGAAWMLQPGDEAPQGAAAVEAPYDAPPPSQRQAQVNAMMSDIESDSEAAEARRLKAEERGYYTLTEGDLMLARDGQQVALRGTLARVRFSSSGLTMYLEFSENTPLDEPRAFTMAGELVDGIRPEELELLIGSRIEIQGEVEIENVSSTRRPRIHLIDRDQIAVLEPEAGYELR